MSHRLPGRGFLHAVIPCYEALDAMRRIKKHTIGSVPLQQHMAVHHGLSLRAEHVKDS